MFTHNSYYWFPLINNLVLVLPLSSFRWAMSSLTLKGKPSDHVPVASASSTAITSTSSNGTTGMANPN